MSARFATLAVLAAIVAAVALAACSRRDGEAEGEFTATVPGVTRDADASPTTSPPSTPTATSEPPPATCASLPADVAAGRTVVRQLTSGGVVRSYRLHIPASASPSAADYPVVLNFHGLGSSALEQEPYSGLVPLSESEGFVLVTPDGTGSPRGWAALSAGDAGPDIAFVNDLLDTLESELCTDRARVYSTGMSNGAFFSSLLGCVLSARIAAIAPVAGVAWSEDIECGRPMPILAFHGVADATVPYAGGDIFGFIPYAGAPANVAGWAVHNGCDPGPSETLLAGHVVQSSYAGCNAPATLVTVEDGGHTWPGAIAVPGLGHTTQEITAAEMIWEFFEDKTVP